jgi:hypothetical protein
MNIWHELFLICIVRSFQVDDWGSDKKRCDQCGDTVSWEI